MNDAEALDAYSTTVIGVAEAVGPSVAAVTVRTARGAGAGSATVISDSGHLLTSAHVVVTELIRLRASARITSSHDAVRVLEIEDLPANT